jgi:phosphatidylglycerol---prolipoprotein diacylglyceryl transferase
MYPRLAVDCFGLSLHLLSHDVFFLGAVAVGSLLGPWWTSRLDGGDAGRIRRATLVLAIGALAGGRLHFVLNHPTVYATNPRGAFALWTGALHAGGALLGGLLALVATRRWVGLPLGRFADAHLPTVGVCIAIARVGCLLHGCCFGAVCDHAWCVSFPPHSPAAELQASVWHAIPADAPSLPVHPVQLYFAASGLLLTATVLWRRGSRRYDGEPALWGLLVFSATSLLLEAFRSPSPERPFWGPLPTLAWVALGLTIAVAAALTIGLVRRGDGNEWVVAVDRASSPG